MSPPFVVCYLMLIHSARYMKTFVSGLDFVTIKIND